MSHPHYSADQALAVLGRHMTTDRFHFLPDLAKSHGSWLVTSDNRELLDCYTAFASLPVGWNHPHLRDPAWEREIGRIAAHKPALSDTFTEHMAELVDTLYRHAIPATMPWIFFIEGGGLAVENALKAAFDWKVRRNLSAGRGERGSQILHFRECFHGRTGYTMSLTDSPDRRKTQYFPKFTWPRVLNPKLRFPLDPAAQDEVVAAEHESLRQIHEAFDRNPDDIAAIIIETIQGEGGDNHFRPQFFQALRRVADEREALLILDEVQAGCGITGTFWAWQQMGIEPDIVAFGKKSQVCGIYAGRRISEVERNVFVEPSRINSTWGGNLVDFVRFQRVMEVIVEERLVENAAIVGLRLLNGLQALAAERGDVLSNARGRGLFVAVDLPDPARRDAVLKRAFENGLLALSCGTRSIRFRPCLNFTADLADEAVRRLSISLGG
jgi:L-lysine 6-transaminase